LITESDQLVIIQHVSCSRAMFQDQRRIHSALTAN